MDSGYMGPRPRVQLFHGDADPTINYNNFKEAIKQWTNVLGLSTDPTTTTTVTLGTHQASRQQWQNSCGYVVLDAFTSMGGDHGPSDALFASQYVVPFLALDKTDAVDPEIAKCGGGMAGAGGSAGATSSGGSAGRGGAPMGGSGGSGGGATGGAGMTGAGAGGHVANGGMFGNGGAPGAAGNATSGGRSSVAGGGGSGGTSGVASAAAGRSNVAGASPGAAGAVNPSGGMTTGGEAAGGSGGASESAGCGCEVAGSRTSSVRAFALVLAALFTWRRRRQRRT